jgi:predicted lipid-binding transport protein (Tim44 family)
MATLANMKTPFIVLRGLLAASLFFGLMSGLQAQWSWRDSNGSRIFSDQPPPASVPEKDILKRPGAPRASAVPAAAEPEASPGSTPSAPTAPVPKIASKDPELEKRKQEAQSKEAAAKKAEQEKLAAAKKENCERAKRSKATFDSGVRISTTNASGEREILGDAARAAETKRLQDVINSSCS